MSCIFCKIINHEIPANRVLEDDEFLAFHDIYPKAPIHLLVIPKKHISDFQHLDSETMGKATKFIQQVAIKMGIDKSGYRIITNIGKDGGQEVFHIHFHILGGAKLKWIDLREEADEAKRNL